MWLQAPQAISTQLSKKGLYLWGEGCCREQKAELNIWAWEVWEPGQGRDRGRAPWSG